MLACLDVYYSDSLTRAAAAVFEQWKSAVAAATYVAQGAPPPQYTPGKFYLRELGPLLAVIQQVKEPVSSWIIDGYCHLTPEGEPGLGAHLFEALGRADAVIVGVAKTRYRGATQAIEVRRGESQRPLFVTAIGVEAAKAAAEVASMAGEFRIPQMLKEVDRISRGVGMGG